MRFFMGLTGLGLVALAGCATPPKSTAPAPVVAADSQAPAAAPVAKKPKNCILGSHVCTTEPQVDPSVEGIDTGSMDDDRRTHPNYSASPR